MQQATLPHLTIKSVQSSSGHELPGHGTGIECQAVNDENYHPEDSVLRMVLSVCANMVGGALLLAGLLVLPQLFALFLY